MNTENLEKALDNFFNSNSTEMVNRIIEALAVCLADQYGETVTATITKQETKNRKSETEKSE